ncbi:MAG: hypothetical protein EA397_06000 [Deltaproteobacteria bacterium]|nr:MAG: hypothetical protein EA397_06000 [Deltaproteobacteria bacterium]
MRFLPLLLLLSACGLHKDQLHVTRSDPKPPSRIAVAQAVLIADHEDVDPFRTSTVVGNLQFSGGYVTDSSEKGLYNVSKTVRITNTDDHRDMVIAWIDESLSPTASVPELPPPPTRTKHRGTSRVDGKDNQSLPRLRYAPTPGGRFDAPTAIPWVIAYYTHNGGWFYGQQWGSGAGGRIRILLAAYDTDGSVLGWTDIDASRIASREFSPTGEQLDDLLMTLERRVRKKLRRGL